MRIRNFVPLATLALIFGLSFGLFAQSNRAVQAQDEKGVACDSTLVTLLLVAEHDYDYLSGMMAMSEKDSSVMMPKLDYGQYTPFIEGTMAMMTNMMNNMTDEQIKEHEAMQAEVDRISKLSDQDKMNEGMKAMGMEAMDIGMYTQLKPGDVAGQDALCSQVRADVEKFIINHLIAEGSMMAMAAPK